MNKTFCLGTLAAALASGCGASMPVPSAEPLQCAPERTLQDKANGIYVSLAQKPDFIFFVNYGDFSQHFTVQKRCWFGCGIVYNLANNDNSKRNVQFVDRIPLGTLDEAVLCYRDDDCSFELESYVFPTRTDGELLNRIHQSLTDISSLYFQNIRAPSLESQLQQDYRSLRSNEGF